MTTSTVTLGSSITAGINSSWLSPSGDFAFGFYPLLSGLFLVGIWFDKIPERTLAWSANRDDPAKIGSTIHLRPNGQLVLTHSNGTEYLVYNGTSTISALMQDDGNFVLLDSSSKIIWQSFDFPTDTILLGQVLVMGQKLYSNANGTVDYSTGGTCWRFRWMAMLLCLPIGCYPNVVMDFCAPNSSTSDFTIEVIDNADFPNGPFADMARTAPADFDQCQSEITGDCFAMAAVLVESVCYKKRMPLLNARRSFPSTSNIVAFLKVPKFQKRKLEMAAKKLLPYLLILALNFCGLHAQILPNISLGSSITAGTNDSWRSLSGEFAFGFYPLQNNLYLMGIWFDKIPERTLVWSANRDTPAEAGSTIRLTFAGQLFLTYSNGSVQSVYGGAAASLGFMENNGNFVLKDGNSRVIWQSFDSPTDTLLPTQVLTNGQMLFSNAKGTTDYSTGNFMLEMQYDGNLVLSAYHFSDPGYWFTGTLVSNDSLVFDSNASLYIVNSTNDVIYSLTENFSAPTGEYYHRATIDDMGNFQQYVYHKSNGSGWISVWKAIHEPCLVNAVCGVNGMCSSPDNETVTCNCIPGYIPLDPNHVSKGCHPETVVNYCADPSMRNFTIAVIDDADFPFEGFADLDRVLNVDVEGCKVALMDDCYSIAASLVDSRCNKKRMPLLNARKSTSTKGITAFVKVPLKSSNPGTQEGEKKNHFNFRAFLEISLIVSATLAFVFGATAIYYHPGTRKFVRRKHSSNTTIGVNFREFKYVELHEATNGFSKTVGRGSSVLLGLEVVVGAAHSLKLDRNMSNCLDADAMAMNQNLSFRCPQIGDMRL
ncbi:hypothetical protein GH714_003384 [Hevea brasiliensis]|uniref:Bulb-type lectin domain-containing protein n=1 Tax=Hevea brasiliensis TaxID=3981 RepID=A0A6A6KAG1_HEVBR|nr:hypothetical protein GH714_003384 [Hevea brasiliensis]